MDKIYGILGIAAKAGKIISGFDSIQENIKNRQVKLIIIAKETSEKTQKEVKFTCEKYGIQTVIFGNIEGNSHAIGKKNRALIGICDEGLANKFLELLNGEK